MTIFVPYWLLLSMCVVPCALISVAELCYGRYPSALAFGGFSVGYVGLAWLYA